MHTLYEIYNTIWNIDTTTAILWNSRHLKIVISQISSQGVPMFRFRPTLKGFMLPQISLGMNPITCYVISINSINRHFLNLSEPSVWYGENFPFPQKYTCFTGWPSGLGREDISGQASCEPMLCRSLGTPARQPGCREWERFGTGKMAMIWSKVGPQNLSFSSNQRNWWTFKIQTYMIWLMIDWFEQTFVFGYQQNQAPW